MTIKHRNINLISVSVPQLRKLYRFLTYNRLTIFLYGACIYLPPTWVLMFVAFLAILFAPYMLFVLARNRKRGWLLFFVIIVGISIGLTFIQVDNSIFQFALLCLPLATFYTYCVILRYTVSEWITDESPIGLLEVEETDRQNQIDEYTNRWISGGS
jgi:hypothetical protein